MTSPARRREYREYRRQQQLTDLLATGQDEREDLKEARSPDRATRIPIRVEDDGLAIDDSVTVTQVAASDAIFSYDPNSALGYRGEYQREYSP